MPLYEYQCEKCGELFEVMQKFSDEPLSRHEKCDGSVHRLLSAPALQFKGSGWYVTDYAKGGAASTGNGSTKKDDAKPVASSSSSETKSSETKPSQTKSSS
ncbi:MAG: zinc ribbon domain-containing protein [Acidobacteriaceae bacterium]|nr:zinc ribbon domain-containing protein [Acidobacteriaceae bacterium]